MCKVLAEKGDYPEIRSLLCMGGINMADQGEVLNRGVHIVIATPGRLMDMLEKKKLNLENCKYVVNLRNALRVSTSADSITP